MISVIVPVYNVEKYLKRCIDSILEQTFSDFELILIDDGSTDNCGFICDMYAQKDNRIKVIHKKNSGVSNSRNFGLNAACGDYITFCDSDDYVNSDWLEHLHSGIIQNSVDSWSLNFRCVGDDGKVLATSNYRCNLSRFFSKEDKIQYLLFNVLLGKCGWEVCTRIFKKSIIDKHNIRFCETCENYAEDLAFVLEYTLSCNAVCTEEYFGYNYFQRSNSMMHISDDVIKIDELNEVAYHFTKFFSKCYSTHFNEYLPLVFWAIMKTEYQKLLKKNIILSLPSEIRKVKNKKWYNKMNRKVISSYFKMKKMYGKDYAMRSFIFSTFCLHKNAKLFGLETRLYYKIKGF